MILILTTNIILALLVKVANTFFEVGESLLSNIVCAMLDF